MNQSVGAVNDTMSLCLQASYGQMIIHTLFYVILLVVSLVGNLLVIFVVYHNKNLHNIINCFILNMCLSDLIVPIVIVPRKLIEITTGSDVWLIDGSLGNFLCKFVFYITDITPSVSILSLVFMTADRLYAVFYPMKAALIPKSYRIGLVVLTWFIPMISFSPYFKSLEVILIGYRRCRFTWSMNTHIIFSSTVCVIYIIIPFTILLVLYSLILSKLRGRTVTGSEELQQQKTRREKTNIAVIKLALVVILAFALCWGPYNSLVFIYSFLWGFKTPPYLYCTMLTVNAVVVFIAYSNTSINPFVYFILNKNYREGLRKTLGRPSHRRTTRFPNESRTRTSLSVELLNTARAIEHK